MDRPYNSGRYYANTIARSTLTALQEVIGRNGAISVLQTAGLAHLIDNFPPDNLDRKFDFADYSAIFLALEALFGPTGSQGLALRTGRALLPLTLISFGTMQNISEIAIQPIPIASRVRLGLMTLTRVVNETSDQHAFVHETLDELIYSVQTCPVCWGRKNARKPVCYLTTGFLKEGLKWLSGGREFRVSESHCLASGHQACEFIIAKEPY